MFASETQSSRSIVKPFALVAISAAVIFCSLLSALGQTIPGSTTSFGPLIIRAVDGEQAPPRTDAKARVVPLGLIHNISKPQQDLDLPPFSSELIGELKRQDAAEGRSQRVRIGFGRHFDRPLEVNAQNAGEWTVMPDGSRVYLVRVSSEGALSIRLHLENVKLPPSALLLVYDPANPNPKPIPVDFRNSTSETGIWTPTIFSQTVMLECDLPPGLEPSEVAFSITALCHQYRALGDQPKAACENDVACFLDWASQAAGVAMITFIEGMDSF